jgi:polygalacturonase
MKNLPRIRIMAASLAIFCAAGYTQIKTLAAQETNDAKGAQAIVPSAVRELAGIAPPNCSSVASEIPQPKLVAPIVKASDFGAKGDGLSDDTEALNRAIQSMKSGGTLVLEEGKTYFKTGNIIVKSPGVHIWGYGATLYAQVPAPADIKEPAAASVSIQLNAPRTAVYGLTIVSNLKVRTSHPNGSGIVMTAADQEAIDNRIAYAGSGIFIRMASNFLVARNVVFRTAADGIHITSGSRDGRVLCNVVRETGDDLIAVVSYGLGEPNISNFRIEGNDVGGNYWGRGITVVGGRDVTIRRNRISETTHAAAIYIASEAAYKTSNVRNVLVEENEILDTQMTNPKYNPRTDWNKSGQGAILVSAQGQQQVRGIIVRKNKIDRAFREGIVVGGNSCDIGVQDNAMTALGGAPLKIQPAPPDCSIACSGNTSDDSKQAAAKCTGAMPDAKGASM